MKGTRYSGLRKGVSAMGKGKGDRNAVSPPCLPTELFMRLNEDVWEASV